MPKHPNRKSTRTVIYVPDSTPAVAPNLQAALLLAARVASREVGLTCPSAREILDATGAGRSRAYELSGVIREWLSSLQHPVGRPPSEPELIPPEVAHALRGEVLEYIYAHPGAVHGSERRGYADAFRHFVVDLRERHREVTLPAFADAIQIPLGTIQDWLGSDPWPAKETASEPTAVDTTVLHVQTLLSAWANWWGPFTAFCEHARRDHALPFGDTAIASLLERHGARTPKRRRGRSPDEEALRDQFETFFANAQWVGDGTMLPVDVDGEILTVNVELVVDVHSGAFVGIDVTPEENSAAVCGAFEQGVETTGERPIALLFDNHPCNHIEGVDAALGGTLRIRATAFRAQNKAHVEGAFGLFKVKLPPIKLDTSDPMRLATDVARLVTEAFGRGINLRPRRDRGGRSRKDLNGAGDTVSPEQRAEAEKALRARLQKQERARLTREARQDPLVRDLLDQAFERLGLNDPERHFRNAIARYERDTIVDAIAIYEGKQARGTLPDSADARYLLGIVRNLDHVHASDAIVDAMLDLRIAAHDALLAPLIRNRDATPGNVESRLEVFVDQAMATDRPIERRFWIHAAGDLIATQPPGHRRDLCKRATRRIHNTFRVATDERSLEARRLARRVWPLD